MLWSSCDQSHVFDDVHYVWYCSSYKQDEQSTCKIQEWFCEKKWNGFLSIWRVLSIMTYCLMVS